MTRVKAIAHDATPQYGQYVTHVHSHITRAQLFRPWHGIANGADAKNPAVAGTVDGGVVAPCGCSYDQFLLQQHQLMMQDVLIFKPC